VIGRPLLVAVSRSRFSCQTIETNVLLGARGAYRLAQPVEVVQLPATVQAILAARIG
jgi:hypothetical protein